MEISISRDKKIVPFSLNLKNLKKLCSDLSEEFDNQSDLSISVDVELPGGMNLRFGSIEEMIEYQSLPNVIKEYEISIYNEKQKFSLKNPGFLSSKASISARSEKEVWCAGMIETAASALYKHRAWYFWIPRNPSVWLLFYLIFLVSILVDLKLPMFLNWMLWISELRETTKHFGFISHLIFSVGPFLAIVLSAFFMALWTLRTLSPGTIRVKDNEGFIRRHYQELTLLIPLVGILVTIIVALLKS